MEFSFEVEEKDDVSVLELTGSLIEKNQANDMLDEIDNRILRDQNKFIINLNGIKFMSSTGLNVLIMILTKARKSGGETVICCVPARIQELLVVTKLNTVFTVCDTPDNALKQFQKN